MLCLWGGASLNGWQAQGLLIIRPPAEFERPSRKINKLGSWSTGQKAEEAVAVVKWVEENKVSLFAGSRNKYKSLRLDYNPPTPPPLYVFVVFGVEVTTGAFV